MILRITVVNVGKMRKTERIKEHSWIHEMNTNSINNMVNSENTSGTSMKDEILNDVLKTLRAENE